MRASVTGTFASTTLALTIMALTVAAAHAQAPPPPQTPPAVPSHAAPSPLPAPGFVSAYEILRTLRSAGFDPLAPPLREGTIYVARATDYRGILMRVVLDARTGAIRDANRIVPGPGNYTGPYGGGYGARAYGGPDGLGPYEAEPEPYDAEAEPPGPDDRAGIVRLPYGLPPDADVSPPPTPATAHPSTRTGVMPLPRPRPPEFASRKSTDDAKPPAGVDPKPETKPGVATAAPIVPLAPAAQAAPQPTAPTKPSKAPSTLSINN